MKKFDVALLFIILIFTFVAYFPITGGFFQHDEWRAFGFFLTSDKSLISVFKPAISHYTPFTDLLLHLYLSVYELNFFWYALSSIFAHLIVVFLSCILFSKLFKSYFLGLLAGLFFSVEASGYQATSWIAADINTHGSTIFGLLALIFFINSKFNKIWLAITSFLISLLFKEITVAFILLLFLLIYIYDKQKLKKNWSNYVKIALAGFFYFLFRFLMIFFGKSNIEDRVVLETQSFADIINNLLSFPAKIFSQSLIPTIDLLRIAKIITKLLPLSSTGLYGTTSFDVFVENVTLQVVDWTIFAAGIILLILLVKKSKDRMVVKALIFGFLFVVLNSFIYVLSPGRSGSIPIVDSRNIYLPSLGSAVFLVSAAHLISNGRKLLISLIVLPFLVINFIGLKSELGISTAQGAERKEILSKIKIDYPNLPQKAVFFMISDTPFYGLPVSEKIFPFETNLGRTLMVWYLPSELSLKPLVEESEYLYRLTEEGYLEKGERGFGYFRNMERLKEAVKKNNLSSSSVISYIYLAGSKTLIDNTKQAREELEVSTHNGQK